MFWFTFLYLGGGEVVDYRFISNDNLGSQNENQKMPKLSFSNNDASNHNR